MFYVKDSNKWVVISREYPDMNSVAFTLKKFLDEYQFEYKDDDDMPNEPPEFRYSEEYECLIPVRGRFYITLNRGVAQIELESSGMVSCGGTVAIMCDKKSQKHALSILNKFAEKSRPSITMRDTVTGDDVSRALTSMFDTLQNDFVLIETSGNFGSDNVCYEFLPEAEAFVPVQGVFHVKEKGTNNVFRIQLTNMMVEMQIEVTGRTSCKNKMEKFLRSLVKGQDRSKGKKGDLITLDGTVMKLSNYKREDVGGLDEQWLKLEEIVSWPMENSELLRAKGITPHNGVLLYGPPGTGKTLIAKVLACESGANFISANLSDLTSFLWGQDEKLVKHMFRLARKHKPAIIFLDEFDAIGRSRENQLTMGLVNQFLIELDGINELDDVLVIGATNRIDSIDPALLRPGRFDALIDIPLPNVHGREKIFAIHTKKHTLSPQVSMKTLAKATEGFSGADIFGLCNDAAYASIRRYVTAKKKNILKISKSDYRNILVEPKDFEASIQKLRKTKEKEMVAGVSDKYIS